MKRLAILLTAVLLACVAANAQDKAFPLPKKPTASVKTTNTINGHEFVDLGLSVKWATCNVGANKPSDNGDYFAWGEITTKSEYTEENSKTYGKSMGSICGDPQYDAATANWGGSWRMPTKAEIEELINKCTWESIFTFTTSFEYGYKVTGKNGRSIFLPDELKDDSFSKAHYWSGTPIGDHDTQAYDLSFDNDTVGVYSIWCSRYYGLSVRPVTQ